MDSQPRSDATSAAERALEFTQSMKPTIIAHLSSLLDESYKQPLPESYDSLAASIKLVFARAQAKWVDSDLLPIRAGRVHIEQEKALLEAMLPLGLDSALFHLARIYDEVHFLISQNRMRGEKGKSHNAGLLGEVKVDAEWLISELRRDINCIHGDIYLRQSDDSNTLRAEWKPLADMSFENLPQIDDLAELLPGEVEHGTGDCAGVAGGGGSDSITLSALGHLFPPSRKMDLIISTRAWLIESQGANGSDDLGKKRRVSGDGGPALDTNGHSVLGTYRYISATTSSGRDLEPAIVGHHKDVFLVLEQGEEKDRIDKSQQVDLSDQYRAVLNTQKSIQTVFVGDTGGDVFGKDGLVQPIHQDLRAQRAMASLVNEYPNLITVVLAPGVDAPQNAPEIAAKAGGRVYHLKPEDITKLHDLLVNEYRMDGSDPERYSRTTLLLIQWLKGKRGWQSLNMPAPVVNTDKNPWKSFGFVRECMGDIIIMPLLGLLPLIDPDATTG